jgi:hypothetical protein
LIAKSKRRPREVLVGIYTSMRADCAAGSLPAIRLSVARHRAVTVRRATPKATHVKQCLAAELPAFVALYWPKTDFANDDRFELGNELRRRPQTDPVVARHHFEWRKRRPADLKE